MVKCLHVCCYYDGLWCCEGDFGLVALEIKHTSTVPARELRSLRDFVADHGARLGVVINNDVTPRLYEERLIGLPFTHL